MLSVLGDTLRRSGKHAAALVLVALDLACSACAPEIRAVIILDIDDNVYGFPGAKMDEKQEGSGVKTR